MNTWYFSSFRIVTLFNLQNHPPCTLKTDFRCSLIWSSLKVCFHMHLFILTVGKFVVHCSKRREISLSCVQLFATPWTVAYQVPPSMGFSKQEYWSGLPFPSPTLFYGLLLIWFLVSRPRFDPWVKKMPWRRKWQPTPVFLPREFRGQRTWLATLHGVTTSWTRLSNTFICCCSKVFF